MNQPRDIERLLDLWLADGPTRSPDRVLDVVADRIERQPQRPAWRLPRRDTPMTTYLKPLIALAAVVLIAVVGFDLLSGPSNGIGGSSPRPSPTLPASVPPSPSPVGSSDTTLPAGPNSSHVFTPTVSFTVPSGYVEWQDTTQTYGVNDPTSTPPGGFYLFRDPAPTQAHDCTDEPNLGIGAFTADSISSAFAADERFQITTPAAVTIGSYTGTTFDLRLRSTWTGTCPWSDGQPAALVLTVQDAPSPTTPSFGMGPGDPPLRVYLLDVGGSLVWIQVALDAADEVLPVLQTLSFAD